MLTLYELNESLLFEWWAQDVAKSMKQKGTVGAFTQQCQDMGFNKSSLACIKYVEEQYNKAKASYESGTMSKKEYDEWALKKKRATLAKTFKKWGSNKKKENKMKLREVLKESNKKVFFTVTDMAKFISVYGEEESDQLSFYGSNDMGVPSTLVNKVKKILDDARIKYSEHK